ncbi:hypothetical protein [Streptomyces sp. IBSBF 2435]|uniref:hypothetical protein n=1 Tax=Streptomyces sp. IBSBF 2435 TaxID=2903531 RepID=UPI002FDC1E46
MADADPRSTDRPVAAQLAHGAGKAFRWLPYAHFAELWPVPAGVPAFAEHSGAAPCPRAAAVTAVAGAQVLALAGIAALALVAPVWTSALIVVGALVAVATVVRTPARTPAVLPAARIHGLGADLPAPARTRVPAGTAGSPVR